MADTATYDPFLAKLEVAERLHVAERTLDHWAYVGEGPPFHKIGQARRYRLSELEAWISEQSRGGSQL